MSFGFDVRPDEMDRLPPRRPWADRGEARTPATAPPEQSETALATWVVISLLGVLLGLGLAKYSQAWAQEVLHAGAFWGAFMIIISLSITVVAGYRYLARDVGLPRARRASRALVALSTLLVVALAWAALNIVWLAGWALPPSGAQ